MQQTITAKLQILVNPSDKQIFCDTMKAYSNACNYVSEYIYKTHNLSRYSVQENTYYHVREIFGLRSQMAVSCVRTVIAKYKSILETQKAQYFSDDCKFGTAKLVNKHGKFYLHIPVTYEISELKKSEISNVVGIDRGIRFLAVTYDSNGKSVFYNGSIVKQKHAHYKALRKQLQHVGTPSSRRRIKAIGQRENRWMNDINHCISKALVENNPDGTLFVIEDLRGIRSATERVRVKDRYVSVSWSYYDLEQKLFYEFKREYSVIQLLR